MKTPSIVARSRQRGFADELAPLLIFIIYGVLTLMAVAFVTSFVLPIRLFQGRARRVALGMVSLAWAGIFVWKVMVPHWESTARLAIFKQCEAQLASVPDVLEVDGILDEGAALRKRMIWDLFAVRHLSFVEIKVRRPEGKAAEIAYGDGDEPRGWELSDPQTSWVRLELMSDRNPGCANLPLGLQGQFNRPPFLPDSCIKLTYLQAPTARYALSLQPASGRLFRQQGAWQLVDRATGKSIASLATVDPSPWVSAGSVLSPEGAPRSKDCFAPHTVLVDRLHGTAASDPVRDTHLLDLERIQAKTDVKGIDAADPLLPEARAVAEQVAWTEQEEKALFNPDIYFEPWRDAVALARERNTSPYGSRLLDLQERKLVSLVPTTARNPHPWQVFAARNGFFALSTSPSWNERRSNLLVRYRRDGSMAWAARIVTPAAVTQSCRIFWPQAIYLTSTRLVLADRCSPKAGKYVQGEAWSVPLTSLPPL